MVKLNSDANDRIESVTLDKGLNNSFGVCIVRGEVKNSSNSKTTGIFIKDIVAESSAYLSGQLKVGDRILSLNSNDVRNATEQAVIELIKTAGTKIHLEIQPAKEEKQNETEKYENIKTKHKQMSIKAPGPQLMNRDINQNTMKKQNKQWNNYNDDEEEDTREMTGRILTETGYEIDRASAGNCKLNKQEKDKDKETPDEFGYTMYKINKRYNLLKDLRRIEVHRPPGRAIGVALVGHVDRQKMSCFVAGIDSTGILADKDINAGDEIIEINGNVVQNRSHLNASMLFQNISGEKIIFITSRRKPNAEGICIKPIKKFAALVDDTKFIYDQFPNARLVQVHKRGFLGIMVIYGKHVEVGNGIFISDLREDSNAALAGINVGDMLLAINKDVTLEHNYDEAVAAIKRAEGIVNLIVLTLKSEVALNAEKEAEEKKKQEAVVEKPQDPSVSEVKPNKQTLIEVKIEKKPLGVIVAGGKNNFVKTGCVITHIYPNGALAADNRLKIFDHIIEANSVQINCSELTTLKVHQIFHMKYDNAITFNVFRADPPELEKFNVEFVKKPGKDLGLSLAPNDQGCTISEITPAGYAEIDNKLQRGDIITKLNGESLQNYTFPECFATFKNANGRIAIEITRPKPTMRTTPSK